MNSTISRLFKLYLMLQFVEYSYQNQKLRVRGFENSSTPCKVNKQERASKWGLIVGWFDEIGEQKKDYWAFNGT